MKNKEFNEEKELEMKREKRKVKKINKKVLFITRIALYVSMLVMIYNLSPRLTEWFKIGLQALIDTPSENITRVITIILAVIFSIIVCLRKNKKGE